MEIVDLRQGDWTPAPLGNWWATGREERIDAECLVASNLSRLILPTRPPNILVILREVAAKTPDNKLGVSQMSAFPRERAGREVAHLPALQTEAPAIHSEETSNHVVGDKKERRWLLND
jgi:hypothetical protein